MSRAFDLVDHDLLLTRAETLGVRGNALNWLRSYLSNRTTRVVIGGVESRARHVHVGTPQGSCISPTLFNIFINTLPAVLEALGMPVLYADDTSILVSEASLTSLVNKANSAAQIMLNWCDQVGLKLNLDKTVAVEFTTKNRTSDYSLLVKIQGKSVINADSVRFLGVHIDQKFTWSNHIRQMLPRLSSCSYLLRNIRYTVSLDVLRLVYFGLFQSIISYGLIFWGGAYDSGQVFIAQKRAVRYMCGLAPGTTCRPHFKQLKILTFPCLYIFSLVIHVKKSGYDMKRRDIHSHDTRKKDQLQVPFDRLSVTQNNPKHMGAKMLNHIAHINKELVNIESFLVFKTKIKYFLIDKCYYSVDELFADKGG